jgi:hypothetical protein
MLLALRYDSIKPLAIRVGKVYAAVVALQLDQGLTL